MIEQRLSDLGLREATLYQINKDKASKLECMQSLDHGKINTSKILSGMEVQDKTSKILEISALMSTVDQILITDGLSSTTATMDSTKHGTLTKKMSAIQSNH